MKTIIFVPVKDYFGSRRKLYKKFLFPLIAALVALMITLLFNIGDSAQVLQTFSGFVDTQISIVAILISFSVAIITILVSAVRLYGQALVLHAGCAARLDGQYADAR